jgi:hypothetical protein
MKRALLSSLLVALTCSFFVVAQSYEGRILGNVTDQTGAVVSGAKVTISNTGTGLSRSLTTTRTGDYVASALPPGLYNVTIESPNFKRSERTGVRLEVA